VHGFILKGRSPSCGIKDVKIYLGKEKSVYHISPLIPKYENYSFVQQMIFEVNKK